MRCRLPKRKKKGKVQYSIVLRRGMREERNTKTSQEGGGEALGGRSPEQGFLSGCGRVRWDVQTYRTLDSLFQLGLCQTRAR